MSVMLELILLLWGTLCCNPSTILFLMQQRETNQNLTFKLSNNNSLLTLSDGTTYQVNIDKALIELLAALPKDVNLSQLPDQAMVIKDHITDTLPDNVNIPMYKSMNAQMAAYSSFFFALFFEVKGGNNA